MHRADFDPDIELEWSETSRSQTRCGFVSCQPFTPVRKKIDRLLDSYSNTKSDFLIWSHFWLFGCRKGRPRKRIFISSDVFSTDQAFLAAMSSYCHSAPGFAICGERVPSRGRQGAG
ncbi:hypothetical protein, partial [Lonsdalea populi]|uniref:hypothetical protein n=2 Tax=Pectobacteriaceae TaxID=1903410 RepID=UPI001C6595CE